MDRKTPIPLEINTTLAASLLPPRMNESSKGTYGKALLLTGSSRYSGAAYLSLEGALRSGVGLVGYVGEHELMRELHFRYPEVIFESAELSLPTSVVEKSARYNSVLVGCGSSVSEELFRLVSSLLLAEGAPLILDADAINVLALHSAADLIRHAKREVLLTPHPLEFSRLTGHTVEYINNNRLEVASEFAREYSCSLLLKGYRTVIADKDSLYINTVGSSALAKGGSGDVLSGVVASLVAQGCAPIHALALAAYLHGAAGDFLSAQLSDYGVTPSDLPRQIAREIKELITRTN